MVRSRWKVGPMTQDEVIEVVIEIPKGSRNKYEYDHVKHVIRLDRRRFSATVYPADYGFVPETLAEDGDPLDVLVLLEDATFPGCWVRVGPIGVFRMEDEAGRDAKIICVPERDPNYQNVGDVFDLPEHLLEEIKHSSTCTRCSSRGRAARRSVMKDTPRRGRRFAAARERYGHSVTRESGLPTGASDQSP